MGFCVNIILYLVLRESGIQNVIPVHMVVKATAKCHILNDYHSAPNNVSLFGCERMRAIIGTVTMKKLLVLFLDGIFTTKMLVLHSTKMVSRLNKCCKINIFVYRSLCGTMFYVFCLFALILLRRKVYHKLTERRKLNVKVSF